MRTGTTFSCGAKPGRESKTRNSDGGAEKGVSGIVSPLLRHPLYFPGSCVTRELKMQREDVAGLAMRGLENPNQCQQTNRRYVLAAEAPKFISLLLRQVPLQDYQLLEWTYTENAILVLDFYQFRLLPVKRRQ